MESKGLICPERDEKTKPSLNSDEQFKTKMSELDAKLSELTALFSGETIMKTRECPFCAEERSAKSGTCRFCKSNLTGEGPTQAWEEDEAPGKIIYIVRGNKRKDMEWHRILDADAAREAAEKKYGYALTIEEVIALLARKGWAVFRRDENTITFLGREKSFSVGKFLLLSCLLVFPGLIYAFASGAKPAKPVSMTFPLR